MNKHLKNHTGEKPHQCTVCRKRFKSGCALKEHLFYHHADSGPYECSRCHKFFRFPSHLISHLAQHVCTPPFGCPLCHKPQGDKRVLYHHLKEHVPLKAEQPPYQTQPPPTPFLCTECGGTFRRRERLLQHLWTHIRAGRGRGGQEFRLVAKLNNHLKTHTGEKPHQCTVCKKRFKSGCELKAHLFFHHADSGPYECSLCNKFLRFPSYLINHLRDHAGPSFRCPLCHKPQGDSRRAMYRHLKEEHVPLKAVAPPYRTPRETSPPAAFLCTECGGTFRQRAWLLQHLWTHIRYLIIHITRHVNTPPFGCPLCHKPQGDRRVLYHHLKEHVPVKVVRLPYQTTRGPTPPAPFLCTECGGRFRNYLISHLAQHGNTPPFRCPLCHNPQGDKRALYRHLKEHVSLKAVQPPYQTPRGPPPPAPFLCTECGRRFRNGPNECSLCHKFFLFPCHLISHLAQHGSTPPFRCPLCHKPQGERRALYHHLKEHVPVKAEQQPHQVTAGTSSPAACHKPQGDSRALYHHLKEHVPCTVCQKEFRSGADMSRHLKTHTGEKSHQCTVCKKRFRNGSALKAHLINQHTDSGPYECSLCHKFFLFPSYLISHLAQHGNTPPFRCPLCHKPQGASRALYHHLKEHVPVKAEQLPYQTPRGPPPPAPFLCTECGRRFRKCERLLQHLWTHIRADTTAAV
ncbi:hypothetical protein FOCC_FOCC016824 [Frankliniella occidentalis]|nr:hypothetical protein FOCC_FOCC016824 [Frankliniella occidentalis]